MACRGAVLPVGELRKADVLLRDLKQESARQGKTMSELVETALRMLLTPHPRAKDLPPLPSFDSGGAMVVVANRDSLYERMGRP